MARYEQDGYCPFNGVTNYCFSKEGQDHGHEWHYGLWRVFGPNVVFASKKDNGATSMPSVKARSPRTPSQRI